MLLAALFKLLGWIAMPLGIVIIVAAWLGYGGIGVEEGMAWLKFLDGSLPWAIGVTVVGGFVTALGTVMARA